MVAELLGLDSTRAEQVNELLRPAPLADGKEPELRVVVSGLTWERYLAFDKALGDDRAVPRCYFLDGDLEIMTTSNEHERVKTWIGDLLADYFRFKRIRVAPRGQATMRARLKAAGAEPDESWCVGKERKFPDLVLEIALTSGGLPKLEIYRRMRIPEVWVRRKNRLEIFVLNAKGTYEQKKTSALMPALDIHLLERCVAITDWLDAVEEFSSALRGK
jgi:Uma2 family endonuclease